MNDLGRSLEGLRVAVQGFGNVGSNAALLLEEQGCKVFAVADVFGGILGRRGEPLPMRALAEHVRKTGSVIAFPGSEPISNEDLLELECDLLVPAALECVLHQENAPRVKAKLIAEAANLPTCVTVNRTALIAGNRLATIEMTTTRAAQARMPLIV